MELLIEKEGISDSSIIDISKDWTVLDKVCISWKKIWDLKHTLNFGNDHEEKFSGGKDGNLIARYRKFNSLYSTKSIEIYDYKGNRLYEYEIKLETNDLFFYETSDDKLIVLTTGGFLLTFFAGREISRCRLFEKDDEILDADLWDKGLVFLTKKFQLYYAPEYKDLKFLKDVSDVIKFKPLMKVVPPREGQLPTILLTNVTEHIYIVKEVGPENIIVDDVILEDGCSIANFSINSNFTNIVFYINSGNDSSLIVTDIDPRGYLCKMFLENRDENLVQLSWCGCDFPIITYENSVNVFLNGGTLFEMPKDRYPFSGYSWIFQCLTYSLVFSSGALFKLNSISEELFDAFRRDNSKASSMDLVNAFLKRSSEKACQMKKDGTLNDAMQKCLKASFEVDSLKIQQLFMYSAKFAHTYLNLADGGDSFADDIRKMRLANSFANELNVIVQPTFFYDIVSQKDIIYRICNRKRFSLALKIADYLSIEKKIVVTEWCLSMAYENQNDEIALRFISTKFQKNEELFEINAIATALWKEGRTNLAKSVAELDPTKMNVVPFFVSCGMWEEALNAAKNSYDSTLFIDTFNKAIDNNNLEIVLNVVKKDKTMFLNIAKLFPPGDYRRIKDIEENLPSYVSERVKAYSRVIDENYQTFSPPSLADFVSKLETSKSGFHKNCKEDLTDNKTKNQVLEEMILKIDYSDVNNINEFIKGFNNASTKIFDRTKSGKYYVMVATVLARHKKWIEFLKLADNSFSKYHYHYVTIAQYNFGYDHALEFINHIHDAKKAKSLEEYLNKEPKMQYESLIQMNIHFRYF